MMLTALTAPIAYRNINSLLIASSETGDINFMWGSYKDLDNHIRWGGTRVIHDNHELTRLDKVKKYLVGKKEFYEYIRVCFSQFSILNCSQCEKCSRTILELLSNNISPTECNFKMDQTTLPRIRKRLENFFYRHALLSGGESIFEFWKEMQRNVETDSLVDMYGSKSFFIWYKQFKKINQRHSQFLLRLAAFASTWKHWIKRQII